MEILIASYYFYPEVIPRAFRTFELAKEFSRQGHNVTLLVPENEYDYSDIKTKYSLTILHVRTGFFINKNAKRTKSSSQAVNIKKNVKTRPIYSPLKWLYRNLYIGDVSFEYLFPLSRKLMNLKKEYDVLISIGLPVSVHLGCALARSFNRYLCRTAIADYGDPFSGNFEKKIPKFHSHVEKMSLKKFDFITVPIEESRKLFFSLKDSDRVCIIPQGFDFSQFKTAVYKKNEIISFAYAGIFYKKVRNPKLFFEYLLTVRSPFLFTIYTDIFVEENMELIRPYIEELGNKLKLINFIPQVECIYELSKFDFLINFANRSKHHSPSKLIDYSLTKRPVFSFSEDNFEKETFIDFLNYNFEKDYLKSFDISIYDIRTIASQFLSLIR
jgi:hypothetical protein